MSTISFRKSSLFRFIAFTVLAAFAGMLPVQPGWAQVAIVMPPIGQMIHVTRHFEPPQMVGLKINLKDPFSFGFIMDQGETPMPDSVKKEEFNKIVKYFLVSLAMPNKDMWVNLSPYESKRIIPEVFAQTEMGRDLLAQDYVLKQFTASLMYPEDGLGKQFWSKVYQEAESRFGTTDINVNTFNKVWIVADHADVYQKGDTAFLVGSHLKVMLEQDFKAIEENKEQFGDVNALANNSDDAKTQMASQVVREIIIPAIQKEVNEGQSFAAVRQIYNAEIMATWFKKTLRESLLGQVFADKSKIAGQRVSDPQAKEKIFQQYLRAYKRGVFNYIKREVTSDGQIIPRRYLSGGAEYVNQAMVTATTDNEIAELNREAKEKIRAMQEQLNSHEPGSEAFRGVIESKVPEISNVIRPMDILDTFSKMQMSDNSREAALKTLATHFTPSDATVAEREQIQDLVNKIGTPQEQQEHQSPAVLLDLKTQKEQLAALAPSVNAPMPEPTARALFQTMLEAPMPQPEKNMMMATILNSPQPNTPPVEAENFGENAAMLAAKQNPLELATVNLFQAPASVAPQQTPAVEPSVFLDRAFENSIDNQSRTVNTDQVASIKEKMEELKEKLKKDQDFGNSIVEIRGNIQQDVARQFENTPKEALGFYASNIGQLPEMIKQSEKQGANQNENIRALTDFVRPLVTSSRNIEETIRVIKDINNTHTAAVEKASGELYNVMPEEDRNPIERVVVPLARVIATDAIYRAANEAQSRVAQQTTTVSAAAVRDHLNAVMPRIADLQQSFAAYQGPDIHLVQQSISDVESKLSALKEQQENLSAQLANEPAARPTIVLSHIDRVMPQVQALQENLAALQNKVSDMTLKESIGRVTGNLADTMAGLQQQRDLLTAQPVTIVQRHLSDIIPQVERLQGNFNAYQGPDTSLVQQSMSDIESKLSALKEQQENLSAQLTNEPAARPTIVLSHIDRVMPQVQALQENLAALQNKVSDMTLKESIGRVAGNLEYTMAGLQQQRELLAARIPSESPVAMPREPGGINLSDEHLTMNIKVDGAGMPLPPQYQDPALLNLNGLVSIIRSITPLTPQNVPALYELTK